MNTFTIISTNMNQGFVFAGNTYGEQVFSRFSPPEYITYFKKHNPDILTVTELLLDDTQGASEIASTISKELALPYWKTYYNQQSWLYTGKHYGMGMFSKFPLTNYEVFPLPNPKIEVDRPDGLHWIMHDKGAQKGTININGNLVTLFNIHYFPFHHFKRNMNEPEFQTARQKLLDILSTNNNTPILITGDFNHQGLTLKEAFPELGKNNLFEPAITVDTTLVGLHNQTDHILYSPKTLRCIKSSTEKYLSDHYALIAQLAIR